MSEWSKPHFTELGNDKEYFNLTGSLHRAGGNVPLPAPPATSS